jgi:hypothetical protein
MFSSIGSYFKSSTKSSGQESNKTNISEQDTTVKTENLSGSLITDINSSGKDMYLQLENLNLLNDPTEYDPFTMFQVFFEKNLKNWK